MDENSKKKNLSKEDIEYLNSSFNPETISDMSGCRLDGIVDSQSSKAIKLDEQEIDQIKKKNVYGEYSFPSGETFTSKEDVDEYIESIKEQIKGKSK